MTEINTAPALPSKIFNTEKTDYHAPQLIFGQEPGMLDSINKCYPKLWRLYKTLKKLDWDENEFDYGSCKLEFQTCKRSQYDMMIKTLAWQWEADSVASRALTTILGPVVTSSEFWALLVEINKNEILHGLTYSEIVRGSFDNPDEVFEEILRVREAMSRMATVSQIFAAAHDVSHRYALGLVAKDDQVAYNAIFMFFVALFVLERVQFMASFAVTFAICDTGPFQPIGKAVQKIAQDEFEIHVHAGMETLRILMTTEMGKVAFTQCRHLIVKLLNEVVGSECEWLDYLYSEGRELQGTNVFLMKNWVRFNARAVARFFEISDLVDFPLPEENPLPFMQNWLDISKNQSSPMEEHNNQYKVNVVKRDDEGVKFTFNPSTLDITA